MVAATPLHFEHAHEDPGEPDGGDRRFVLYGVPWDQYVAINDALGDRSGVRVCYCEGTLELMSPGLLHEDKKSTVSRLLEIYALVHDLPLQSVGSMTYRKKPKERGAEPDEGYFLGKIPRAGKTTKRPPDLVIEVAVSRSAIDKLSLYAGLGVRELWIWRDDSIAVFHLGKNGYREAERSKLLPDLDMEELASFARRDDQAAAVKAYWKRLNGPARRR